MLFLWFAGISCCMASTWCDEVTGEPESAFDTANIDQPFKAKWIEPEELHERLQSDADRPILADLRAHTQFSIAHIPGALSVRGSGLRAVLDGSNRSVVLIGTGYDREALAMWARKLGDAGTRVTILRGGMAAWALHDHLPVAGARDLERLLAVPAERALLLIENPEWRVLSDAASGDAAVDPRQEPAGYLWVGSHGANGFRRAAALSSQLGSPVFYTRGKRESLHAAGRERRQRLAAIDSRPAAGCGL